MQRVEFVHPENAAIFAEIEDTIFTPETAEDWRYLHHPSGRPTTFIASYTTNNDLELYIDYIPNHPRNSGPLSEFKLPAFMLLRRYGELFPTRFGKLPQFVLDSTDTEFVISTEYYLNSKGQGVRHELIEPFIDEQETEAQKRKRWEEKAITKLSDALPIGGDIRNIPLDDEDREYIEDLLRRHKAGEFNEGSYQQDSSIT